MSVLGVDVGGTNVRVALISDGRIVDSSKYPRPASPDDLVTQLVQFRDGLASGSGVSIDAVGVGVAGLVRFDGVLATSPNIPGYDEFPIRERLSGALGIPVAVENDATAAFWIEMATGAAAGRSEVLYVSVGTGIGGAIAMGGAIQRGKHGFAGEIGHMTVQHDGPLCPCGRRGCWETLASGRALGGLARAAVSEGGAQRVLELAGGDVEAVVGEHVAAALLEGDPASAELLGRIGYWLGVGIASLVSVLDPELVVVGGGVAEIGEPLLDAAAVGIDAMLVDAGPRGGVELSLVRYRADGGALGAARLAEALI